MENTYEAAVEIREAISELTKELREVRSALNAIQDLFAQVIDPSAGEQFPGYIRVNKR